MGGKDSHYGYANVVSMALVLATAPLLGQISDQTQRRVPFLIVTTCLCVVFTFFLGTGGLLISLIIFGVANYMFQSGLIFYDSMLTSISTKENIGKIGSFGVSLGYVGSLIGVGSGLFLLESIGRVGIFRVTAVFFLIFALPCFIFVKDKPNVPFRINLSGAFNYISQTLKKVRAFPGVGRFLIGRVFYTDAVNTLIIFMGIFVTNELGFSDTQAQIVLLVAVLSSMISAFIWGFVVDSIGPKRSLNIVLCLWMIVCIGVSSVAILDLPTTIIWAVAAMAGTALGGTWCADRPYLLRLVPTANAGEFFGLYNMVGRFASIMGPVVWVFAAETLGLGRPVAVLVLLLFIVIAYFVLRGVTDKPNQWEAT